ncbi:MAG TPA: serine/threonine-protein kinase [Gemmatimonadaceae bacterium]|nr:serine/threonine-protein kinase [Gemmatimonadaceae bacterium]
MHPSSDSPLLADRYRVERELGRGGMAVVHLAYDTRHDRRVAIKFIGEELGNAVGTQRFLQEIKVTAALQHPHVLAVYDSGVTADNVLYYVMPFVDGGSLRTRLEAGPLPLADAVKVARDVADALAFAHQRGIVHRDVKPENILFSDGHALVADFGIARMVTNTNAQQLTAVGVVVGTPPYMSPEQGFGGTVDLRSDVYSLACVVYEMLTGKVPFTSPAAGQWTQFGMTRMPPPLRAEHPEIPEAVEEVLVRALAPSPDDRYPGAREFAAALDGAASTGVAPSAPIRTGTGTRSRRAWRSGLMAGAAVAFLVIASLAFFAAPLRDQLIARGVIDVNETRALLVPVQSADSAHAPVARAAEAALREELRLWAPGVSLVSPDLTLDALGGNPTATQDDALRAARLQKAGMMLWARVRREGSAIESQLYDSRTGSSLSSAIAAAPASDSAWSAWARATAATLLGAGDIPPAAMRALGSTRSLAAWRAYIRGHRALDEWRLPQADSAFAQAVAADARFSAARVWLAQTLVWSRSGKVADWRRHAEESLMLAGALDAADRTLAQALSALGRRQAPRACAAYASLVARDSLNARAWLGLGDCHALDSAVVRDARSPSGWSYRGSYAAAMRAYERAVRLAPAAHVALPLAWVERLLPTQPDRYRRGIAIDDTTRVFGGRPSPSGDSVIYVPALIVNNRLPDDPPGFEEALHRNRLRLLEYVSAWAQRTPADREAYEALASVQESRGELTGEAAGGRLSASAALDTAQRLARDAESRARISASRVRVLIKAGEFERARELADSLLRRNGGSAKEAHWIAGVAAVTGRAREAARLARLGDAPPVTGWDTIPAAVGQAATLLLAQAAMGICDDGFRASVSRMDALIDNYAAPSQREATRAELTAKARRLAVPCLGAEQITPFPARSPWDRMQTRLAGGDLQGVRSVFDSLQQSRRNRTPGGMAIDYTFTTSWLLAAAGDSSGASRHLDQTLEALPTLGRSAVWELAQAAALGRSMIWRADLALARGDMQNASRWAAAVSTLWKNADVELQPVVSRMRTVEASR